VGRVTLKDTILDVVRRLLGENADTVDLGQAQQDFLNDAADMGADRLDAYRLAEQYYCGEKGVPLLDRAKEYLERSGLPYTENFCRLIVLSQKRRLKLEGFQVEDDEAASDWLTNTWFGRRRGDRLQGVVHLETLKLGDGFVIVDWDTRRAGLVRRGTTRGRSSRSTTTRTAMSCCTSRRPGRRPGRASRTRTGRTIRRLNLYYPDRVEKWFSPDSGDGGGGSVWAPYLVDTDEGGIVQWPIPWTMNGDFDGEPIGIPVFHFREQPGAGLFGESVLRDPIRLQDALDKQSVDLHMVMDQLGWRWPWIAGLTEKQQEALQLAIGDIALLPEGAEMGQLDGQDPRPMMETLEGTIARMAVLSSTPLHELTVNGEQPSGESRKMAELRVAAAEDRHVYLGNTWEDVARMANRLAVVFGDGTVPVIDPDAEIDAQWDSAATRDELLEAQTLVMHQELGASTGFDVAPGRL
jgi:hypothetical protein